MIGLPLAELAVIIAVSGFLALAVLGAVSYLPAPRRRALPEPIEATPVQTVFLLDRDGGLIDHNAKPGPALSEMSDWQDLRRWLEYRFSDLPDTLEVLDRDAALELTPRQADDPARLRIENRGKTTRVILSDDDLYDPAEKHDALRRQSLLREDSTAFRASPYAMWKTDLAGALIWRNPACDSILREQPQALDILTRLMAQGDASQLTRHTLDRHEGDVPLWLEVKREATETGFIHYAADITAAIRAEDAQHRFVQTLTKTFASLATGLAVFGRDQQLALFNPALIDLTGVSPEFLSARPSLNSFFDTLRDRQVLPEPRSYASWRAQLQDMIKAASDGDYLETWSLPSGLTYRVTGRPHPDGAVAFLFEDITAEISLTRRFRTQIDLRQSVLDKLDDAIAVFGPDNILVFCNQAFSRLAKVDPDSAFADMSTSDIARICRDRFPDMTFWSRVADQRTGETFAEFTSRRCSTDESDGRSGGGIRFTHMSISGGAVLIGAAQARATATRQKAKPAA